LFAKDELELTCKKIKEKLLQLIEVHDRDINCNSRALGHRELLSNQPRSIAAFGLINLALCIMSLALIIHELLLLGSH
jgi:hypothetical protein